MSDTKEKERCFVIMPISDQGDYPMEHFTKVYEQIIKPAVEEAGYEAYRVDENNICDSIINKIFNAIQDCPMAICDLSNRNPNVLYELGLRQAYDKPVVLIQDDKTQKIFDVSGISTVFYKSARMYEDVMEARENIKKAIIATKEGKISSLAKIMKVNKADFSQVEVSQNDKMNVILEGIYSEIRELKNRGQTRYLTHNTADSSKVIDHTRDKFNNYRYQINRHRQYLMDIETKEGYITLLKELSSIQDEIVSDKEMSMDNKTALLEELEKAKNTVYTHMDRLKGSVK